MKKYLFLIIAAFSQPSFSAANLAPTVELSQYLKKNIHELGPTTDPLEDLLHNAYVYQTQSSQNVNWLYIGFAPRIDDGSRVSVTFSKKAKTMRVSIQMTKAEIAEYPRYLVRRALEVQNVIASNDISFYQQSRLKRYFGRIGTIQNQFDLRPGYNEAKYSAGLNLLKSHFPQNIFEYISSTDQNSLAVVAHFVYPITVHASKTWPRAGRYLISNAYDSPKWSIQERRSTYTKGSGVKVSDIFGGFPAIWIKSSGAGTGVHGPIRFSKYNEPNGRQVAPYGNQRDRKLKFWQENEFRDDAVSNGLENNLTLRWDVVRTNNSHGCFRAETLELRALLPSDPYEIWSQVHFNVIDHVDQIQTSAGPKFVDVNYYLTNPYRFPSSRQDWLKNEIGGNVEEFMENSILFDYLDPSTLEFRSANGGPATSIAIPIRISGAISKSLLVME